MNFGINKKQQDNLDKFKAICNCFIGLKTEVFAYSPGLQELEILFEKDERYFIVKFVHTLYVKTYKEWIFEGVTVEVTTKQERIEYKFSDRNYFKVICLYFGASEILNGREVLNYEGNIDI